MPKDNKKTVVKPTPDRVAPLSEEGEMQATNLAEELDHEHPTAKYFEKLNALVNSAAEGTFKPTTVAMALHLEIHDTEGPVAIPKDISGIMSTYGESPNDVKVKDLQEAISEMKMLIAEREERLLADIITKQAAMKEEIAAANKVATEEKLAAQEMMEKAAADLRLAEEKLKSMSKSADGADGHSDDDSDSSLYNSANRNEFTVHSEQHSKGIERLAKAACTVPSASRDPVSELIKSLEKGATHKARAAMKAIYEMSTEGLSIGADAAGNKPLSEAISLGNFGGGSEGKIVISTEPTDQVFETTTNQVISNTANGDKYAEFSNLPIDSEDMANYLAEAKANLVDFHYKLPPGMKRVNKTSVKIDKACELSATERVIAQRRVYKYLVYWIKKGKDKFENSAAYLTIISRIEEIIKLEKEVPMPAYEVPSAVTLCARIAKKHLHLGSYLIGEIQKLNKDAASYNYTVNGFTLFTPEAQMRKDECMNSFVNRTLEAVDHCNSQTSPIDLAKFGWPTRGDGPGATHALFTDEFIAYFLLSNFNRVVLKHHPSARTYITEDLLEQAADGSVTMDVVNDLVSRMNKLGIGAVKPHNKKSEVDQTQAFSSMSKQDSKVNKHKSNDKKSRSEPADIKMKLYKEQVASLGSGMSKIDDQIEVMNKYVQKMADGRKLFKKTGTSIEVDSAFGSIQKIKLPNERMNDQKWALFQVIRDVYGGTSSGQLSNMGRAYKEKYDAKYSDKIEAWRLKNGIKPPLRESHNAHSTISAPKKSRKKSKKTYDTSSSSSDSSDGDDSIVYSAASGDSDSDN